MVVLTPELERYTRALHKKLNLTFDILTDLHLKPAEQFRLVFVLPDYLRELYKSFGSTLDRFHDESEYRLPMPARYVIDQEWIIRASDVNADYTIRPEPSETIRLLRTLHRAARFMVKQAGAELRGSRHDVLMAQITAMQRGRSRTFPISDPFPEKWAISDLSVTRDEFRLLSMRIVSDTLAAGFLAP